MSRCVCDVCFETPCACEENNRVADLMAGKAALFDEMLELMKELLTTKHSDLFGVLVKVAACVEKANKIAEASK